MKVMHNVKVYTMDEDFTTCDAIVWEKERIIEVGQKEMLFDKYQEAEKLDGQGKILLPGFIDPHIHFLDGLFLRGTIDCSPKKIPTIDALKKGLSDLVQSCEKGHWIVGQGYDTWAFPDKKGPDRYDLDQVCPDNPVIIIHYSIHECVVNSRALEIAGIDRNTPQPYGGMIVKDKKGEPTGHLIETAHGQLLTLARESQIRQSKSEMKTKIAAEQEMIFGFGITRMGDPAVSTLYRSLYEEAFNVGSLKIPIVMYPCNDANMLELPWDKVNNTFSKKNSENLMTGPLKIFVDGSDQAAMVLNFKQFIISIFLIIFDSIRSMSLDPIRTGMRSPVRLGKDLKLYLGATMARKKDYQELVSKAIDRGFSVAFHAVGNEAVNQVVEIMKVAGGKHKDYPPARIEHCVFIDDEQIKKIRDTNMAVVTQPYLLTHMNKENVPPVPGIKQLPLRSLIDSGVRVAGSSDWPVASCNPLLAVERAVTRVTKKEEVLQERESISVKEAFSMYTCWAAEILGCSQDVGSLEAGKRSDFILLSADPFESGTVLWENLTVVSTFLGGEQVF